MSYDGDNQLGRMSIDQPRGLITSPAFSTAAEANQWGKSLEGIQPFVPARWGRDALDLLGDDAREEARASLNHLDPNIDRERPIKLVRIQSVWGPIADPDGSDQYLVVMIADFQCSAKGSGDAAEPTPATEPVEELAGEPAAEPEPADAEDANDAKGG